MKKIAVFFLMFLFASGAFAQSKQDVTLVVNNPKVMQYSHTIGNITVGDPEVVNFRADRNKKRITLIPKNAGTTSLFVYDQKGTQKEVLNITVYNTDPETLLTEIRELLVDIEGIEIKRVGSNIVIDGEVVLPSDLSRIKQVAKTSKNIVDLTTLNKDANDLLAKRIEREIGYDEVSVRNVKGKILLEGEVYTKQARDKAEKIANLYSSSVINALEIREIADPPHRADTIQVTAHFVEVSKNFSKNFNFRWTPVPAIGVNGSYTFNPVSNSENFTGAVTGTASDILPKLNLFRTMGIARVLENPTVSVKSGDQAVIESGTKLGFPVAQANGSVSLEFQNVGALLKIEPKTIGTDIDMNIEVKVSSLGSPDINGGVAISENLVQTSQLVRSGQSVVIGGLVRHSFRQAFDRPPSASAGGSTPVASSEQFVDPFPLGSLFTLFKSNDLSKQRSQFMIFITPRIVKFSQDANKELKDNFNLYDVYPTR
ncbi:MAG: pilus assembly protein N-terminal domain-containing protein [Bdellovibrionales bacterium]|nr:pilus assembly protein N-terminal domain-containing protein [Bdellovibrionales bacterium]